MALVDCADRNTLPVRLFATAVRRRVIVFGLMVSLWPAAVWAAPSAAFSYRTLTVPGSAVAYFPTVVTGRDGSALVMTAGPVVWQSKDGKNWTAGNDAVNPSTCSGGGGSPPQGAILGDHSLIVGQACSGSDASLDVFRSVDGGSTWLPAPTPGGIVIPASDGGFVSASGGPRVYAIASSEADLTTLLVRRSDDDGQTWDAPAVVNRNVTDNCATTSAGNDGCVRRNITGEGPDFYTPVQVDPTNPDRLYVAWWADDVPDLVGGSGLVTPWEHATKLFVARSDDAGAHWSARLVLDAGDSNPLDNADPNDLGNWAPSATVDAGGDVYVAVARRGPGNTETHVMLITSRDHGASWSTPLQIDSGLGSTFGPAVTAAGPGQVDVAFYGTAGSDEVDPSDVWNVYLDRVRLSGHSGPRQEMVAAGVHRGAICPQGSSPVSQFPQCTDRAHLTVGLGATSNGSAMVAYVDESSGKPVLTVACELD